MSHTREEEWKQVRALHLVRDERDRLVAMRSCQITLQVMNGLLFGGAMTALLCYAITRRALFQTVGITLCAVILTLFFVTMAANRYFERRM